MKNRIEHEKACDRVARRFQSRLLYQYVARKLRSDPAYPAAYNSIHSSPEPLLDVGCGLGLLGFYLRERGFENPIIGLDRDLRKIRAAQQIAANYTQMELHAQDVRGTLTGFRGNIAVIDVLHYLTPSDQSDLLAGLAERVAPDAVLILRDCPRDGGWRYLATFMAEKFAQLISWNVSTPLHFPDRESILKNFAPNEFEREVRPLWGTTPFNNHLFTFRRRGCASGSSSV
jgi:2-polyprenyl-3-methyl-5-hydroxy-6-metoxy-1,4-benzoquinol methylase